MSAPEIAIALRLAAEVQVAIGPGTLAAARVPTGHAGMADTVAVAKATMTPVIRTKPFEMSRRNCLTDSVGDCRVRPRSGPALAATRPAATTVARSSARRVCP